MVVKEVLLVIRYKVLEAEKLLSDKINHELPDEDVSPNSRLHILVLIEMLTDTG